MSKQAMILYRVTLRDGILPITAPYGTFSGAPEANSTLFRSLRAAKRAFYARSNAEIARLRALRVLYSQLQTRRDIVDIIGIHQNENGFDRWWQEAGAAIEEPRQAAQAAWTQAEREMAAGGC